MGRGRKKTLIKMKQRKGQVKKKARATKVAEARRETRKLGKRR